jgi:hypothetical protein
VRLQREIRDAAPVRYWSASTVLPTQGVRPVKIFGYATATRRAGILCRSRAVWMHAIQTCQREWWFVNVRDVGRIDSTGFRFFVGSAHYLAARAIICAAKTTETDAPNPEMVNARSCVCRAGSVSSSSTRVAIESPWPRAEDRDAIEKGEAWSVLPCTEVRHNTTSEHFPTPMRRATASSLSIARFRAVARECARRGLLSTPRPPPMLSRMMRSAFVRGFVEFLREGTSEQSRSAVRRSQVLDPLDRQ